jgi:hypothetical protein
MEGAAMKVRVEDYPQLRTLCWSRPGVVEIEGDEVLTLYERGWRFVDQDALSAAERRLISDLTRTYGNGVFNG